MNIKKYVLISAFLSAMGCSSVESKEESHSSISQPVHAWSTYKWNKPSGSELQVQLNENLSGNWEPYLAVASSDWNVSSVLETTVVQGTKSPKRCQPTLGKVEVCNASYGKNGWLGIAQIWLSGGYIVQGTVKLNDSYFNTTTYGTPPYRHLVMCQEVGHTFGLGHQDENQTNPNLGSCMDYSNHPAGNEHPNAHDYAQLETIYATAVVSPVVSGDTANEWGELRSKGNHSEEYIRRLGNDEYLVTHVFTAE